MADSSSKKMSHMVGVEDLDSDDSENIMKFTISELAMQKKSNFQIRMNMLENSKYY
jgi:hypothetical protein